MADPIRSGSDPTPGSREDREALLGAQEGLATTEERAEQAHRAASQALAEVREAQRALQAMRERWGPVGERG